MTDVPTINQDEFVEQIRAKLESKPYTPRYSDFDVSPPRIEPAAYVLLLGAGFSYGVVPLVDELMQQTIGDYYYPDQNQWHERPESSRKKNSRLFWADFNKAAERKNLRIVELEQGLPKFPGAAYQELFTYIGARALFGQSVPKPKTYVERYQEARQITQPFEKQREEESNEGERFVKGFLRFILLPGIEAGFGATGRMRLNPAHEFLAKLLDAQQVGKAWNTCAFCRTIVTTNFDTLLQNALQSVRLLYRLTDTPERGFDPWDFQEEEGPIHLVYVHGSILRYNPASTIDELNTLKDMNIEVLHHYLEFRDIIVIGYGGWEDVLMGALRRCNPRKHMIYWCDIADQPAQHVVDFLRGCDGRAVYVRLGKRGADDLMRTLYEALMPQDTGRSRIK